MTKETQLLRRQIEALKLQRTLDHNEDLEREINHLEIKLIQEKNKRIPIPRRCQSHACQKAAREDPGEYQDGPEPNASDLSRMYEDSQRGGT